MNNPTQMDDVERLFVRSCLECSPQPGDSQQWLPFQALHSGIFAYSQLCELKNELLHDALESPGEVLPPKKICGLANQAAQRAWSARFPVLVFPCLFEDLLRRARERFLWMQAWQTLASPSLKKSFGESSPPDSLCPTPHARMGA